MILFFALIGMIACAIGISFVVLLVYGIVKMWNLSSDISEAYERADEERN